MGIAYAICRAIKIKSLSALKAHAGHAARTRETLNASTVLTPLNQVLVGSGDPAADALERLSVLPKPPRKNGVLAIELLLTASPEYFRPDVPEMAGAYDINHLEEFNTLAVTWAKGYFGPDNVVSIICHVDESTPHLSVTVIPVDDTPRKKGGRIRLNAARWLDGKKKLQAMQDSFAEAVAGLGLERGQRGSKADHQSVKNYYGQMADFPELKAHNVALKQFISKAAKARQKSYEQGRQDQAAEDHRTQSILRHQIRRLLKLMRIYRRLMARRIGTVGIIDERMETSNPRTISSYKSSPAPRS